MDAFTPKQVEMFINRIATDIKFQFRYRFLTIIIPKLEASNVANLSLIQFVVIHKIHIMTIQVILMDETHTKNRVIATFRHSKFI